MIQSRYSAVAMALHWITALIIIAFLIFGENMIDDENGGTDFTRSLHVSLGLLVLVLTLIRLFWRFANPPPALPATMKGWEMKLSKVSHAVFYLLMLALPLTGWLAASAVSVEDNIIFTLLGGIILPLAAVPELGELLPEAHILAGNVMIALLALHILAALKHQFIDKDNLLARIVPGMR
jgi:cytochrome b561